MWLGGELSVMRMEGGLGFEMGVLKKEGKMKTEKVKKRGLGHVGEMVGGANFVTVSTAFTRTRTNILVA